MAADATHERNWPLFWAAAVGDVDAVRKMISSAGIDVNFAVKSGATPLYIAAEAGQVGVVRVLLADARADTNAATKILKRRPLMAAAVCGHVDVVRALLASGRVNQSEVDGWGDSALDLARWRRSEGACELLQATP